MLTYILLILGFILLIKGADLFVDGSSSIARLLRIPAAVIGLTIVAFGTSAPELSVSCSAALAGQNEIAISNVLGSNIFNLMVVTGACAAISAIPVNEGILKREFPFSIVAAALLLIFSLFGFGRLNIGRLEGLTLLVTAVTAHAPGWRLRDGARRSVAEGPDERPKAASQRARTTAPKAAHARKADWVKSVRAASGCEVSAPIEPERPTTPV